MGNHQGFLRTAEMLGNRSSYGADLPETLSLSALALHAAYRQAANQVALQEEED